MPYSVDFTSAAEKQFGKLPLDVQVRIKPKIDALANDPRPPGCTKLKGHKNAFRIRIGDYRVLYEVNDQELTVLVFRVAGRDDVYD